MDAVGNYVITWESAASLDSDSDGDSIQARHYNSLGTAQGSSFQINTVTTGNQGSPEIAMQSDGDFIVTWTSEASDGTDSDSTSIQARRFNSLGTGQSSDFQVNTYTTFYQFAPEVALDGEGDFVIVWTSYGSSGADTSDEVVVAQRYNSLGSIQGSEFEVNTYTTGYQVDPAIAMDADGNFVVAWRSDNTSSGDSDGYGVFAQRFDVAGNRQGDPFQVNSYTTSHQYQPAVALNTDGELLVTWSGFGSAGTDTAQFSVQKSQFAGAEGFKIYLPIVTRP